MQAHPTVPFVKLVPEAIIPSYAKPGDAGMDLHCVEDFVLDPHHRRLVRCGVACAIPYGWEGQCRPRSGNALKKGVTVLNAPGTIDSGYRGEMGVLLINHSAIPQPFKAGDRIAQLVISPVAHATITEVSSLPPSERGTGGFGSTGS
jgi:dUTP pyrophosphatase